MKMVFIAAGIIIAVLALLLIAVIFVGYRLPAGHSVSRSVRIDRPVTEVYRSVRDFREYPAWRPDVKSVEIIAAENGAIRFRENGANGLVTYELTEDIPEQRMVTTIVDRDLGYSGSWTYVLSRDGDETVVTVTENGEVSNPLFRFMSHYIFGKTATIDAYLEALSQRYRQS